MLPLTLNTKLAYWFGQIAEGLKNTSFAVFLLFYYNQVLGVSGTLCGIALFVGISIDAVSDPLMGSISDAWRSKYGRRHSFMYVSALPMAVCFFFLFSPLVTTEIGLFIWLLVFVVLTRFTMTLYTVPHNALGAELTNDYHERNSIMAFRLLFGSLGSLIVYGLGFGIFFAASDAFPNGQTNVDAYPPFAAILALGIFVSIIGSALGTKHLVPHLPKATSAQTLNPVQILLDVRSAFQNSSFIWLVGGFLLVSLPVGLGTALQLYLNTYFWQISPENIGFVLGSSIPALMLGLLIAPYIMKYIEKKQALYIGAIGWVIFYIAPIVLHFAGLFPIPGSVNTVYALVFCHFMAYLVLSPLSIAVSSMLADVADEQQLVTNARQEGVFFGAYAFVIKATAGIGPAIAGVLLDFINWPDAETIQSGEAIPPDTLFQLAMIAGPGLAIGFIPALLVWRNYSLDKARHKIILEEIRSRESENDVAPLLAPIPQQPIKS